MGSVFKCPNCYDEGLPANELPCWKCGSRKRERDTLECPCCGEIGAAADERGEFYDGQPLACECRGCVSVDADGSAWINIDDAACPFDATQCPGCPNCQVSPARADKRR